MAWLGGSVAPAIPAAGRDRLCSRWGRCPARHSARPAEVSPLPKERGVSEGRPATPRPRSAERPLPVEPGSCSTTPARGLSAGDECEPPTTPTGRGMPLTRRRNLPPRRQDLLSENTEQHRSRRIRLLPAATGPRCSGRHPPAGSLWPNTWVLHIRSALTRRVPGDGIKKASNSFPELPNS